MIFMAIDGKRSNGRGEKMGLSKLVIFGSSGNAKVVVDIIESNPNLQLIGFIDKYCPEGKKVLGYQVIGDEISLPKLMARYGFNKGVVGIGDNYTRSEIVAVVEKAAPDFQFINCVHESARISKYSSLGVGNVIMPGVTINASSEISNHCVLNTNSSLDHDCKMGDYSQLAPEFGGRR